jgi:hypothetical protein
MIIGLFNNASSAAYVRIMNLKEQAVTYFKVISQHLHGGSKQNHENSRENPSPCTDSNARVAEYEVRAGLAQRYSAGLRAG